MDKKTMGIVIPGDVVTETNTEDVILLNIAEERMNNLNPSELLTYNEVLAFLGITQEEIDNAPDLYEIDFED